MVFTQAEPCAVRSHCKCLALQPGDSMGLCWEPVPAESLLRRPGILEQQQLDQGLQLMCLSGQRPGTGCGLSGCCQACQGSLHGGMICVRPPPGCL